MTNDKTGYNYTGDVIDCEKLSPTELLSEFAHRVEDYDHLKDDELCFLEEHSDPAFRTNEEDEEYANLKIDIDNAWCRVREIMRIVYKNKDFWIC